MWWMRARRRQVVVFDRLLGGQQHRTGTVGDLAGHRSGHPSALAERWAARPSSPAWSRAASRRPRSRLDRDDLVVEVPAADRGERPLVAGQREPLHILAGDVPALARSSPHRGTARSPRSPYRCDQPCDSAVGVVKPNSRPTIIAAEIGIRLMFCIPPARIRLGGAGHDRLRPEGDRLLAGSALTVDGDSGHLLGVAGRQPGQPADVSGLTADGVDAADDRVVDGSRVDVVALEDPAERMHTEVDRVQPAPASRCACRPGCAPRR